MKILVTGAGGFLGGHLVGRLLLQGHDVRAVSRGDRSKWSQLNPGAQNWQMNLAVPREAWRAVQGVDRVFHMAAMIGGIGYLESRHADCTASVAVTSNMIQAAVEAGVKRFLFPSSACVYPDTGDPDAPPLQESDVEPYAPRGGYGWSKLFSEQMLTFYRHQHNIGVRIARLGTVYGPFSPMGEAEKAPIAICRKVLAAYRAGPPLQIEVWGDGKQTRSFLYVDDAIDALLLLMESDVQEPVNVASALRVSVDDLVDEVVAVSGVEFVTNRRLIRLYRPDMPQGVRGRMSDLTRIHALGWRERVTLRDGLERTFDWVKEQTPKVRCAA